MDQETADRLARIEKRLEHLELQTDAPGTSYVDRICTPGRNHAHRLDAFQAHLADLAQGQTWLLKRVRTPMSYIDKVMREEWLKRRIAQFREAAEPPPHLRRRDGSG
jgi:hypothetical protein